MSRRDGELPAFYRCHAMNFSEWALWWTKRKMPKWLPLRISKPLLPSNRQELPEIPLMPNWINHSRVIVPAMLLSFAGLASASPLSLSTSGTFSASVTQSDLASPGAAWSLSFDVNSPPAPSNAGTDGFDAPSRNSRTSSPVRRSRSRPTAFASMAHRTAVYSPCSLARRAVMPAAACLSRNCLFGAATLHWFYAKPHPYGWLLSGI